MSAKPTHYIHLNSDSRNKTIYTNPAECRLDLPMNYSSVRGIRLLTYNIGNDRYNVSSSTNTIVMTISGYTQDSSTITPGCYDLDEFKTQLKTCLDAIATSQVSGDTFTITENAQTGQLVITSSTNDFTLDFDAATFTLDPRLLGYDKAEASGRASSSNVVTSTLIPDVNLDKNYFIKFSNLPTNMLSTNTNITGQFIVPVATAKFANLIFLGQYEQTVVFSSPTSFNYMDVEIRDADNNIITLNSSWEMVLHVY